MTPRIIVDASPGEVRIAVLQDGALQDYAIWRPGAPDGVGDLYRGRVTALMPALGGAFVALNGTDGFLPDSDGAAGLTEGTILGLRVTRAPQGGKGPRLTAWLSPEEQALTGHGPAGLIRRGPGALEELAALHAAAPVLVTDPALAAALRPKLGARVRLDPAAWTEPLAAETEALAETTADLPGGIRASFHPTPALVAIDLDTAAASAARQPKQAAQFEANRAALEGLARQIRLRNLSGAILIDFAGLSPRKRAALGPAFAAALAPDPLRPRLLGFTALGLAEIVRPRVHPPLHELLSGHLATGLAVLRQIAALSAARPYWQPILRAAPALGEALRKDPVALPDLARRIGRDLILRSDPSLSPAGWHIEE